MTAALLDVNVLVALFDPAHPNHDEAHAWFGAHRKDGWAASPLTLNGCVRVLSNPGYPTVQATPAEVVGRLRVLCRGTHYAFWPDSVSLLDETLFRPDLIAGSQQITDIYLLGLAVRNRGRLVTFDRRIPLPAVVGARSQHLELLG